MRARSPSWRSRSFDAALSVTVVAVNLGGAIASSRDLGGRLLIWPFSVVASAVLQGAPLVFRRRHPAAVFALTTLGLAIHEPLASVVPPFGFLIGLYSLASQLERRRSSVIAAAGVAAMAAYASIRAATVTDKISGQDIVIFATLSVALWLFGSTIGTRRAYTAALEERAALLEREREDKARRAVEEERARIARELHDVVAHHVSTMVVQAGAARRVLERHPDESRAALRAVESAGRNALAEMRRLLSVLRNADDAALEPQPGVGRLYALIDTIAATGLRVELDVHGAQRPLPHGVDLSAYRIVQEALTNVLKHAGATCAHIALRYADDHLEMHITDDGEGPRASSGQGHGLIGMRERVALFGGSLHAGPGPSGGFAIHAVLPITEGTA